MADVVKDKDVFFYREPRLGSFMSIKFEYYSCLFDKALDKACDDYIDVDDKNKDIMEEKKEFDEEQAEEKAENPDYVKKVKKFKFHEYKKFDT